MDKLNNEIGGAFAEAAVENIRKELNAAKGQWPRLVELSDGRLTYAWIAAFAGRGIKMPHFDKVAELGLFLGHRFKVEPCGHFNKFKP